MKSFIKENLFLFIVFIAMPIIILLSPFLKKDMNQVNYYNQEFEKAQIIEIISEDLEKDDIVPDMYIGKQKIRVKILSGQYADEIYESVNQLSRSHNILARKDLKIIVGIRKTDDGPKVWVYNYIRSKVIYTLAFIFFSLLIIFGGKRGLKSSVSLIFTAVLIIFVLLPLLFTGKSPIWSSIMVVSITTIVSFLLIGDFKKKTLSAIIGTISGIIIAGLLSYIAGELTHVSGINLNQGEQLLYLANDYEIQVKGLMFSAILIASLGAVMDVAMSISSSIYELHYHSPNLRPTELLKSGLNIGKDIMGTMANTLILAFAGGSLSLFLLIWGYQMSYTQLINMPFVSVELIQGLSGSIGIILTVPMTAISSVFFIKNETGLERSKSKISK